MGLAIITPYGYSDQQTFNKHCDEILNGSKPQLITKGSRIVWNYAQERGLDVIEFIPNFSFDPNPIQNNLMLMSKKSEAALIFDDGVDKDIQLAIKTFKKSKVICVS